MKLTAKRDDLSRVLKLAERVVDKRGSLPILRNVLLDAATGLGVAATDLNTTVTATVPATVAGAGKITVEAARLSKVVGAAVADDVTIELRDRVLHLTCGRSRFDLPTISPADFPKLPSPGKPLVAVDGAAVGDVISKAIHAASRDETRYMLCGVNLSISGGTAEAMATDGYQAVVATRPCPGELAPFLLSVPGAAAVLRAVIDSGVKLGTDGDYLFVAAGETTIAVRRIDAQFPDLKRVIPQSQAAYTTVSRDALLAAIGAGSIVGDGATIQAKDGAMTVTAKSDGGEAVTVVEAEMEADTKQIGFAIKYMKAALEHCGDRVRIGTTGELDPITLHGDGYTAVVMPMRV